MPGRRSTKPSIVKRAQEYFQQGNFPKARVAIRNVLKIDPKDVEAYFLYAQVEEKERNWRNALAGYQQVVEMSPDHDRALVKLAKYYLEARDLDQVTQIAKRILEKSPGHVSGAGTANYRDGSLRQVERGSRSSRTVDRSGAF